ncbi:hypothetical protein PRIPAC_93215 [Pristionchus pacificus]|uniref:Uncharacterized protein n=1 Tax=Pristionchus pacificus TaxID=54126 RepID=A0A2A6BBB3_PRIPA|nr:hypothetical protein PRIPAC_93215 [Pristionchus pacificus]|eukprot:PDM63168.1 hypothetical protein PRIPAC_50383 [Pristionchus pacificus]
MITCIHFKKDLINDATDTEIAFYFDPFSINQWEFYVWRSYFRYFPQKLDVVNFWSRELRYIAASMISEELRRFLAFLKPLLKRTEILELSLTRDRPERPLPTSRQASKAAQSCVILRCSDKRWFRFFLQLADSVIVTFKCSAETLRIAPLGLVMAKRAPLSLIPLLTGSFEKS